jgi:hypothetical protein
MHETRDDLDALQAVLDASYARAGAHLLSIHRPERRMTAQQMAERLTGMCLLSLATITGDGRPVIGAVDGIFYRGAFHFGSAPDSVRFAHIRRRPAVSAMHLPAESLAVTVHGRAVELGDLHAPEHAGFRQSLLDIYTPRYGAEWEAFLDSGPVYARIEPERVFAFWDPSLNS